MFDRFIKSLKSNEDFVSGYIFKRDSVTQLWVVVKDSVAPTADKLYEDFLTRFEPSECSIMIYDARVLEEVENKVSSFDYVEIY